MTTWNQHKKFITAVGVALVVLLVVQFAILAKLNAKDHALDKTVKSKRKRLGQVFPRAASQEIGKFGESVEKTNENVGKQFAKAKRKLEMQLTAKFKKIMKAETEDAGDQWLNELGGANEELQSYAIGKMEFPYLFSLPQAMPTSRREIEAKLRQLAMIRDIMRCGVDAGITRVTAIKYDKDVKTGAQGYAEFINEYPITLDIECSLDSLMTFLYKLRQHKDTAYIDPKRPGRKTLLQDKYFIVRSIDIQSVTNKAKAGEPKTISNVLKVSISIASMTFFTPDEGAKAAQERSAKKIDIEELKRNWVGH